MKKIIILGLLVLNVAQASAQKSPDIETDRPDQTETPFSVGTANFQAENGYSIWKAKNKETNINKVSLLRYGLSEKFELRAEVAHDTYYNQYGLNYQSGVSPVEVGFKVNLIEEKGWIPKTSLITHIGLPKVASKAFKGVYTAPSFRFTTQNTLNKRQSLSVNLGGEWSTADKAFTPLYTLATGYDFSKFLYGYVELFGFLPKGIQAEHTLAGGFAFLVNPNLQFDASGGYGLTPTATEYYWALGLSFRLLKK